MRRNLLIAFLALGTVLGFASGIAHHHHHHGWRHGGPSCGLGDHGPRQPDSPRPPSP